MKYRDGRIVIPNTPVQLELKTPTKKCDPYAEVMAGRPIPPPPTKQNKESDAKQQTATSIGDGQTGDNQQTDMPVDADDADEQQTGTSSGDEQAGSPQPCSSKHATPPKRKHAPKKTPQPTRKQRKNFRDHDPACKQWQNVCNDSFKIDRIHNVYAKRLKTNVAQFRVQMLPLEDECPNIAQVFDQVKNRIEHAVSVIKSHFDGDSYGAITIIPRDKNTGRLVERDCKQFISSGYSKLSKVTFEQCLERAKSFLYDDLCRLDLGFELKISATAMPKGYGRGKSLNHRLQENIGQFMKSKRSIVDTSDRSPVEERWCFWRAVVAGIYLADNPGKTKTNAWEQLRRHSSVQRQKALDLAKEAGIDLETDNRAWTLDDAKHLQQTVLKSYRLITFLSDDSQLQAVKFGTMQKNYMPPLYLFLHEQHWYLISSVAGFFGTKYFCDICMCKYNNEPHRCAKACTMCKQTQCNANEDQTLTDPIKCDDCNREFLTEQCYKTHKTRYLTKTTQKEKKSECEARVVCKTCRKLVERSKADPPEKHNCMLFFCTICRIYVDQVECLFF